MRCKCYYKMEDVKLLSSNIGIGCKVFCKCRKICSHLDWYHMLRTNLQQSPCLWNTSIPSQLEMVFDYLFVMSHLIRSLARKRLCGSSAAHTYFLIRLNSLLSNLSSVQRNLVKVAVMCVLWFHTFDQVLFDMPKNEDVTSFSLISIELHLKVH